MPGPKLIPVATDQTLPARVDVVVIGGGIIGTSTALELAERGQRVLLAEKGDIGGEQSSRNWGWVRLSLRDPREIPLMIHALELWKGMDARTGRATGYCRSGIAFAAKTPAQTAGYERWAEHLAPHQIRADILKPDGLDGLVPGRDMRCDGALHLGLDGRAEPQWAAPAIAEAARDAGASVLTGCAVRALDLQGGRVAGVITERGPVAAEAVVLAGGAWSRLFSGNAGIDLPQLKVMNSVLRTTPVDGPETSLWSNGFAFRKRADGGYTIAAGSENLVDIVPDSFRLARQFFPALRAEWRSLRFRTSDRWRIEAQQPRRWSPDGPSPFEACRVLDPAPDAAGLKRVWAAAQVAYPFLKSAEIAQSWAGLIDVTPDAVPVISDVGDLPGFFVATGFSGHGFGIGPAAGALMADLVTGAGPVVDPAPFRLSRFFDGSPVVPMGEF